MGQLERKRLRLTAGTELSYVTAGDPSRPALLLLHGFPSSANTFRELIPALEDVSWVIAPDLPGFGASEPLATPSFSAMGEAVLELLRALRVGPRCLYLHDFGAPVAFHVALHDPAAVRGLIVQNANAHRSGLGPQWKDTLAFWAHPDAQNEAAATAHLTAEGVRQQYVAGVPDEIAARIAPAVWAEDWRVMSLPGRLETQRALIRDYGNYVGQFEALSQFLVERRPAALMVWGRHDAFFSLAELTSWMEDLPRMEAHVLDAGHFLLETHARPAAELIRPFLEQSG